MQTLVIPRLKHAVVKADDIPATFLAEGVLYAPVTHVNWPESFP